VQLTYKGSEKFRSSFGGLVSLSLVLFLVSAFAYKLNTMFKRSNSQIKKNTLYSISNAYVPPYNISAKNISVAFAVSDFFDDASLYDPT